MNRPELYQRTVDTLLTAYANDELRHANCEACVVGNICATADIPDGMKPWQWGFLFQTGVDTKHDNIRTTNHLDDNIKNIKFEIDSTMDSDKLNFLHSELNKAQDKKEKIETMLLSTGYTIEELMKIEHAFETSIAFNNGDFDEKFYENLLYSDSKKGQYIGLLAVLNTLAEIHEMDKPDVDSNQTRLATIYANL